MRRRARGIVGLVVLSLGLGVVTTYGVAWGLMNTVAPSPTFGGPVTSMGIFPGWLSVCEQRWGVVWHEAEAMDLSGRSIKARRDGNGVVPSWSLARCKSPEEVQPLVKELEGIFTLKERASGWPRLAVVERTVVGHTATVPVNGYDLTLRRHFVVNPWFREALAFIPLWSGFLQDTAVFGFGWMALIGCGRLVRRRRRAAKGVCPKCRYDLRGLAGGVCPECGSAVKGM